MARTKRRQLPFTIEIEWPAGPLATGRSRLLILLAAALVSALFVGGWRLWRSQSHRGAADAVLRLSSEPTATAYVDGHKQGLTPVQLALPRGLHQVTVAREGFVTRGTAVELHSGAETSLDLPVWVNQPPLEPLKPPFPGATVTNADFVTSREIALSVALPDGRQQLWLIGADGSAHRVGPTASRLALSPDGAQVAFLAPASAKPSSTAVAAPDILWTGAAGSQAQVRYAPRDLNAEAKLFDLTWPPDGEGIVTAIQSREGGHTWTELRALGLDGSAEQLARFPSDLVSGSFSWSPSGNELAFLTRGDSGTALCTVGFPRGRLRYLADLKAPGGGEPLPFPPMSWSSQGQLVYSAVAAGSAGGGGWLLAGSGPNTAVFLLGAGASGRQLGPSGVQFPAWLDASTVIAVQRPASGEPVVLDSLDVRSGHIQEVGKLALPAGSDYAIRWDVPHARAIVAVRRSGTSGSGVEFGWVSFGSPEVQS